MSSKEHGKRRSNSSPSNSSGSEKSVIKSNNEHKSKHYDSDSDNSPKHTSKVGKNRKKYSSKDDNSPNERKRKSKSLERSNSKRNSEEREKRNSEEREVRKRYRDDKRYERNDEYRRNDRYQNRDQNGRRWVNYRNRQPRNDRGNDYQDHSRDRDFSRRDGRDYRNDRRRRSRSRSFDHSKAKWGKFDDKEKETKPNTDKEKPNFGLTGKLTEERNTYRGVVIKYSEPPEARKPKRRWRLYPFKGEKALQTLYIHRESAYLIGRDRKLVDLPVDHPSCSKQHAALQYRLVQFTRDDGSVGKRVRPYLIDLESANGTFINNKKIDPKKYVELLERDVIKFGFSSREYVMLHENSKDEAQDDDVKLEEEPEVKKED